MHLLWMLRVLFWLKATPAPGVCCVGRWGRPCPEQVRFSSGCGRNAVEKERFGCPALLGGDKGGMEGKLPCKSLWLCFPHSHCWMRDPGKGFGSMGGFVIQSQGTLLWVSLRIRRDTEPRVQQMWCPAQGAGWKFCICPGLGRPQQ